jgi:hypothetical protein
MLLRSSFPLYLNFCKIKSNLFRVKVLETKIFQVKAVPVSQTSPGETFLINRLGETIMVMVTKPHMERVERFLKELNFARKVRVIS